MPDTRDRDERQRVIHGWFKLAFGEAQMADPVVRSARLLEETAELAQACGLTKEHALRVLDHVYSRPHGNAKQEAGAVGVTLLALCETLGLSADQCELVEITRVLAKIPIEEFTARNAEKAAAIDAAPETRKRT